MDFWKSKTKSMTMGNPEIVGKAFAEGQSTNACNVWITTFRKLPKCSLLCMLLWSHWIWHVATGHHAQCQRCFLPFQTRNEPGLHAHSTCLTGCMELAGHSGWCNASSKCETLQIPYRDHTYRFYLHYRTYRRPSLRIIELLGFKRTLKFQPHFYELFKPHLIFNANSLTRGNDVC